MHGSQQRLIRLEMMRAVFSLTVFFNHLYSKTDGITQYPLINMLFSFATEAVMGFFVLSGCVISLQRYTGIKDYVGARIRRIAPIYYIALAFTVGVMIFAHQDVIPGQLFGNMIFLQTLQGHIIFPLAFNLPTWSLSYEAFYYIAFIFILLRPWLVWPLFIASGSVGFALRLGNATGFIGWSQNIFAFFSCWLVGVIVVKKFKEGHVTSLQTGTFLFIVGVCLSRAPLSVDYFDFTRLFSFALGIGFLCSALLAIEKPRSNAINVQYSVFELNLYWRSAIATGALALLWGLSPSLLSTKSFLTVAVLMTAAVPTLPVWAAQNILWRLRAPLVYIGGLSYALFNNLTVGLAPLDNLISAGLLSLGAAHVLDYWLQPQVKALFKIGSSIRP
jgi:peptidoglycan/LPS O-acetylase OafA/YrhL